MIPVLYDKDITGTLAIMLIFYDTDIYGFNAMILILHASWQ